MTQTLNALHTGLSGGRKSFGQGGLHEEAAGVQNTGIRHVGLRARNPEASAEFYRDVLHEFQSEIRTLFVKKENQIGNVEKRSGLALP